MRWLERGAATVALAALALPVAAHADELLVLPYTCSVVGGQPVLTPGPDRGYRVLGKRDQRKHQACSPVNPDMCRQWTVHRFDLDCDGQRVSWVSVVAATNEGSRRAWLLDGRLLLRMGPRWSLAPDDPCAQERGSPGKDERPIYGGRLQRECAQRLAMAPPAVVEMPFGYAPMLGVDGIFVPAKTPPPVVAGAPQPPTEPLREPKAGEPKAKELPPPPAPQPAPKPKVASTPKAAPTPPPAVEDPAQKAEVEPRAPAPKVAAPPSPPKETGPAVSHGPRPVTIPPPPGPEGQKGAAPSAPKPADTNPDVSKPAATDGSPIRKKVAVASAPKDGERPATAVKPMAQSTPKAEPESTFALGLPSLLSPTTTGAIIAFAGLALGLLAAFALARRREHARDAGRRRRNISAMSLDGRPASARPARDLRSRLAPSAPVNANAKPGPAPTMKPARAPTMTPARAATVKPIAPSPATGEMADWGDRMPRTREEALEVLGIGIAPSATAPAIKKIVDGLRMSWHPDLAQDETDRALREHRSKQINAAWEILQGQRAEV